jgi:hypothetical protein
MAGQKRLGELLVEMGFIDPRTLQHALEEQKRTHRRLGKVLVELGAITEERLVRALSLQLGIESCDPIATPVHARVRSLITAELAHRCRAIPIALRRDETGQSLFVATADPLDRNSLDVLRTHVGPATRIRWMLAGETEIELALARHYGAEPATRPVYEAPMTSQTPPRHMPPELQGVPIIRGTRTESSPPPITRDFPGGIELSQDMYQDQGQVLMPDDGLETIEPLETIDPIDTIDTIDPLDPLGSSAAFLPQNGADDGVDLGLSGLVIEEPSTMEHEAPPMAIRLRELPSLNIDDSGPKPLPTFMDKSSVEMIVPLKALPSSSSENAALAASWGDLMPGADLSPVPRPAELPPPLPVAVEPEPDLKDGFEIIEEEATELPINDTLIESSPEDAKWNMALAEAAAEALADASLSLDLGDDSAASLTEIGPPEIPQPVLEPSVDEPHLTEEDKTRRALDAFIAGDNLHSPEATDVMRVLAAILKNEGFFDDERLGKAIALLAEVKAR